MWRIFLLTPLREGRPAGDYDAEANVLLFLLTPLREGRRVLDEVDKSRDVISTHAPAGGATQPSRAEGVRIGDISTHAPAGGATTSSARRRSSSPNFYSRPCGRGDGGYTDNEVEEIFISTHAPAGGATQGPRMQWA